MMRATAAKAAGWTTIRPLGARGIPTSAAKTAATPSELVVVQTWARNSEEDRALRDVRALVSLRHANVAKVREVVEDGGEIRLVTQFVEGESLAALRKAGRIPLAIELRILVDALTGIAALHAVKDSKLKPLGFVHAEIAPANVIVGLDGVARVVQLAGSHAAAGAQGADTVSYLAPEILLADDAIDHRVDVYGVGVMLWEALAGTRLFNETAAGAIVTSHLSGRIKKAPVPADAEWAAALVDVAAKAIATDPAGRFANANDLATEIKRVAKTNLAPTFKVAALVKERGLSAIEARRTALGAPTDGRVLTGPRPRIATPEREARLSGPVKAEAPVPAPVPATGEATTKPTPLSDEADAGWSVPPPKTESVSSKDLLPPSSDEVMSIDLVSVEDEIEDSAVKLRPAPVPSAHDRITDPTPIDARLLAAAKGDESTVPVATAAPVIVVPPAPPAPIAAATVPEKAPDPIPVIEPIEAPVLAAPPVAAFAEPEPAPVDSRDRRKLAAFLFLGIAFLFCVLAIALRPKRHEPEAKVPPTPKPIVTAAVTAPVPIPEPTATASAEPPAPTNEPSKPVATAETTAEAPKAAANEPPPTKPAEPSPPVVHTAKPTTNSKPKPKSTYDPLGI